MKNRNRMMGTALWMTLWLTLANPLSAQNSPPLSHPDIASGEIAEEKSRIEAVLKAQTVAWNNANLERFMETYWKSDQLTFSGGGVTARGWQATLDRYKKSYATPEAMGKLHFDQLEITILESKTALVLGHWHLTLANDKTRNGNFSLVMHKIEGQWLIIHDHSSEKPALESN